MTVHAKICGLTTRNTVEAAVSGGTAYVGFVFYPPSPRYVTPEDASILAGSVPESVQKVALTVDAEDNQLSDIVTHLKPDLLQLHGHESVERVIDIKDRFALPIMKAVPIADATDVALARSYEPHVELLLFDAKAPPSLSDALPGGNALAFDWSLIAGQTWDVPWMLAGGLGPDNVAEAVVKSGAALVDASSGVEATRGHKDPDLIKGFPQRRCRTISHPKLRQVEKDNKDMTADRPNSYTQGPDEHGHFGIYGGRFVAETLMPLVLDLETEYEAARNDQAFQNEFAYFLEDYVGRPNPLYFAERLTEHLGGAKIYFKRDELNHTGAHKINNCIGQILLAKRMGKTRIIAETGAGQHGVATATVAARFGLPCVVYMGETDIERQSPNVFRMKLLGAEVKPVFSGTRTLKDAMNEALRDWVTNVEDTFYIIGTVAGPHPYPELVRDFQSVIGREARSQILAKEGRLPDTLVACIGGGSNAMGLFYPFLNEKSVEIVGVEAAGKGVDTDKHAASLNGGRPGVLHGNRTYLLQDDDGQIAEAHSISAGLDYPGIGPEHAWLNDTGRVTYVSATDEEALEAFQLCCRLEGIIPALEPSHALAEVIKRAPTYDKDHILIMNMCGRGDKDIFTVADALGVALT